MGQGHNYTLDSLSDFKDWIELFQRNAVELIFWSCQSHIPQPTLQNRSFITITSLPTRTCCVCKINVPISSVTAIAIKCFGMSWNHEWGWTYASIFIMLHSLNTNLTLMQIQILLNIQSLCESFYLAGVNHLPGSGRATTVLKKCLEFRKIKDCSQSIRRNNCARYALKVYTVRQLNPNKWQECYAWIWIPFTSNEETIWFFFLHCLACNHSHIISVWAKPAGKKSKLIFFTSFEN